MTRLKSNACVVRAPLTDFQNKLQETRSVFTHTHTHEWDGKQRLEMRLNRSMNSTRTCNATVSSFNPHQISVRWILCLIPSGEFWIQTKLSSEPDPKLMCILEMIFKSGWAWQMDGLSHLLARRNGRLRRGRKPRGRGDDTADEAEETWGGRGYIHLILIRNHLHYTDAKTSKT